ncbi:transcriptional regulator [Chelativorans sp. SCAU2101]|jgi:Thioredoxin-related protein|uniref:Transcriptional regulator n=1 Tax=Chelativorans petroleitrophicus TaxID=2975484 RepID=A0A9X3B5A2_9HYPH|nr:transcriptional regulator [Chelativorans petroleitrophicus]MCT8988913.1 transcriptional regulator [Chelativorans petroleitrophicus]
MRATKKILPALAALLATALPLQAAELIMLERPGCVWCAKFNEEIAPAYAKTEQGRRAPLRRVDITKEWPEDLQGIASERITPSFVLIEDGKEVGRIRGYPGGEFFWYLLDELIAKLDPPEGA